MFKVLASLLSVEMKAYNDIQENITKDKEEEDTIKFETIYPFVLPDDIDLGLWNEEIIDRELQTDYDGCGELLHELIDEFVSNYDMKTIEKVVYDYGIGESIKLYSDTYGDLDFDKDEPQKIVRCLAYVVIKENININDEDL